MRKALCVAVATWSCVALAEKPHMAVVDLEVAGGVEPSIGRALSEAVAAEVAAKGFFQVISAKDIQTLLGHERQQQLLGCSEQSSCMSELAGALGARFVLAGSVAKLGDAFQLTLEAIDSQKVKPIGRSVRIARGLDALQAQLPYAVSEATGTPAPPPPSHLLAYAAMASGSALVIAGGVVGFQGLSQETSVSKELSLGATDPAVLKPSSYYQDAASQIRLQKSLGLAGLIAGAGLVGLGFFLNPKDVVGHATLSLAPGGASVAVAGSFP
jgi:TolB-like protein